MSEEKIYVMCRYKTRDALLPSVFEEEEENAMRGTSRSHTLQCLTERANFTLFAADRQRLSFH